MVFRSFPKLHQNGPVPHQISPPNSHLIKPGASFPGFLLTFPNHTLGEAPPSDTANHHFWPEPPSQKTCLFHPAAGESHPSRLRASISSQVTASASRPPNFTFPSLPVRQWVLIFHRTPARASRPDELTFSTPRPARLTHPDCKYFPPVGCWQEPPGHTTYLSVFTCPTQQVLISRWTPARASRPDNLAFQTCCSTRLTRPTRRFWNQSWTSARASGTNSLTFLNLLLDEAYPSDTAIMKPQSDVGESLPDRQSFLFHPAAGKAYPTTLLVDCEAFRPPKTLPFCLNPSDLVSPDLPTDAGESTPGQTILSFQVHARRGLPVRHGNCWNHRRTSAGATPSQTNSSFPSARTTISNPVERYVPGRSGNLSFQPTTGEVQPSNSRVLISRQMTQEPPGWTTSPFPPTSAKLTHQTGGHAHQLDDG